MSYVQQISIFRSIQIAKKVKSSQSHHTNDHEENESHCFALQAFIHQKAFDTQ